MNYCSDYFQIQIYWSKCHKIWTRLPRTSESTMCNCSQHHGTMRVVTEFLLKMVPVPQFVISEPEGEITFVPTQQGLKLRLPRHVRRKENMAMGRLRTKYVELPPLKQLYKVTNVAALNILLCGLGKLANISYMWHTFMYQQALLTKYMSNFHGFVWETGSSISGNLILLRDVSKSTNQNTHCKC